MRWNILGLSDHFRKPGAERDRMATNENIQRTHDLSRGRTRLGFMLTAVLLLLAASVLVLKAGDTVKMKPNEIGDFASGVFAAMAFIWLILGYFQQSDELRLNTTALQQQANELKRQVEENEKLVAAYIRQAVATEQLAGLQTEERKRQLDAEFKPVIVSTGTTYHVTGLDVDIANHGGSARNLRIGNPSNDWSADFQPSDRLNRGSRGIIRFRPRGGNMQFSRGFIFEILCEDTLGRGYSFRFRYEGSEVGALPIDD